VHRAHRHVQARGDLGRAQVLEVAQQDRGLVGLVERAHGGDELLDRVEALLGIRLLA
jgi:hypothetical protein